MSKEAKSRASDQSASDGPSIVRDTDVRTVAEDAPVMLWLTNAGGKVVFTNSKWQKFVGATPGEPLAGDAWIYEAKESGRNKVVLARAAQ